MATVSDLYKACRNGDLSKVQQILPSLSIDQINQLEPNGSTALHAASFYGHMDIVKLLLSSGARRNILNKYELTPADEAQIPEMKQLFKRSPTEKNKRFANTTAPEIEWARSGFNVREISLVNIMNAVPFENLDIAMTRICEAEELRHLKSKEMSEIRHFLEKARKKNDPAYLLRAYTAETDFYPCLNRLLAELPFRRHTEADRGKWYIQFAATVGSTDQYAKYGWKGVTYRGMFITKSDLNRYKVGDWIVNKAFLSTSRNRHVAKGFIKSPEKDKLAVLCKYNISRDYDAFDISGISEYPDEEEVLIFPNTPFETTKISTDTHPIEIELS